ncbi:hypothetical protein SDC9_162701 [bioreactor metagenome]|uniref:Uncharacterized protein n=1 Tax=bioreactor metagenome TaxID=1076179 RepID=A0A645FN46_9ZZZZ
MRGEDIARLAAHEVSGPVVAALDPDHPDRPHCRRRERGDRHQTEGDGEPAGDRQQPRRRSDAAAHGPPGHRHDPGGQQREDEAGPGQSEPGDDVQQRAPGE